MSGHVISTFTLADATSERGRLTRLLARVRGHALDRALSNGADPVASPQLAARAARLAARPSRDELANSIERLVELACEPPCRRRVELNQAAIRGNADAMREIAAHLHGPAPVYARGVATLQQLVTDGTGPVFHTGSPSAALTRTLERASATLRDYAAY